MTSSRRRGLQEVEKEEQEDEEGQEAKEEEEGQQGQQEEGEQTSRAASREPGREGGREVQCGLSSGPGRTCGVCACLWRSSLHVEAFVRTLRGLGVPDPSHLPLAPQGVPGPGVGTFRLARR